MTGRPHFRERLGASAPASGWGEWGCSSAPAWPLQTRMAPLGWPLCTAPASCHSCGPSCGAGGRVCVRLPRGWGQQGRQLCTRPQAGVQRRKGHLAHLEGTWLMLNSPPGKRGARCEGHAPGLWNCPAGPGPAPGGVCRGPHGRRLPYPTPSADQHESGQSWEGVGTSSGITGTPAGLLTSPQLWWAG